MVREGNSCLGLAVPVGRYQPPADQRRMIERYMHRRHATEQLETLRTRIQLTDPAKEATIGRSELAGLRPPQR
jgi:hypothetical protein